MSQIVLNILSRSKRGLSLKDIERRWPRRASKLETGLLRMLLDDLEREGRVAYAGSLSKYAMGGCS